jgi:hypothetical protein
MVLSTLRKETSVKRCRRSHPASTKRAKTAHITPINLPIKDPNRHTSARLPEFEEYTHDDEYSEFNKEFLKRQQLHEAEVDAWVQEVVPRLHAGEKIPLGNVRKTSWELFSPEHFSQYLGWHNF